jgi:peptidoglycan/LPS O-acetylase OafA/YrhL
MRIPSLFGLRAICISFVLLAHLSGTRHFIHSRVLELYGNLGSRIFLVLSGYLITSQLIREYERTGTISLRNFYLRRAYRIFPAAYVFMAVTIALNWHALKLSNIATVLTYTGNFYRGHWVLGHLWSLGVEEQFYLLWPLLLVLFFSKRKWIVLAAIIAGPPLHVLFWLIWGPSSLGRQFPLYMDALAMGCAMSLLEPHLANYERMFRSRWFVMVPIAAVLLPLVQLWSNRAYQVVGLSTLHLGIALSLRHLIARSYAILNYKPVAWFGGITYSLYLWQQLFLNRGSSAIWTAFPLNLLLALACGTLSYYAIEQPFLKLREARAPRRKPQVIRETRPQTATAEVA